MEEKIVTVSNILNDTNAYNFIAEALKIEIDNDSQIFREIEEFIVEKFEEMNPVKEFKLLLEVEVTDEDGELDYEKEIDINVFAKSEQEAIEKADECVREQNPEFEDFCINVLEVDEV